MDCINAGAAGGADFPPAAGQAELLEGPSGVGDEQPGELGPDYNWRIELQGVSPRFMRTVVEQVAAAGDPHPLRRVSILGSLPPDQGPHSVRGHQVSAWMRDPRSYVER